MGDGDPTGYDGATVAANDIARLANVGRAAVSNWRRRYPDFPKPVAGTAASPLYALTEVEAWLIRHGKDFELGPGDRLWQRIRGTVDDLRLGALIGQVGAFLVFHQREPQRWHALARQPDHRLAAALTTAVAEAVPDLPESAPRFDPETVAILRAAAQAAGEHAHREVFGLLCDRYLETRSRWRLATPAAVAELMVDVANASHGVVLDPACGTGGLLLTAHAAGADRLLGQDVDVTAAAMAGARLLLHQATSRVEAGDSLRDDAFGAVLADAVLCDPPFNERPWGYDELTNDPRWEYGLPPRGEPELAWVQHCLSHVAPGGRVAIVMPAGAASRRPGRRIRGNLLRSGALRAVISLAPVGLAADLWLLSRPGPADPTPSHVLMLATEPTVARSAWHAFLAEGEHAELGTAGRAVPLIELLGDDIDLSPLRRLATPSGVDGDSFARSHAATVAAITALAPALPQFDQFPPARPTAEVSLAELVRAGAVVVHQAPLKTTTDNGLAAALTVKDVERRRPPSGRTTPGPGAVPIQPGDVVMPVSARDPVPIVLSEGGAILGPQLYLFRVDPERLDPHFLAGFLRLRHNPALGYRSGATITRSDVYRVTLPRLPITEQRRYGEAFQRLAAFEAAVREVTERAAEFIRRAHAGLAAGTLHMRGAGD